MINKIFAKSFVRFALVLLIMGALSINAKEPTSWFVGFGGGYGRTQIDRIYSNSAKTGGMNVEWLAGTWNNQVDSHYKSWGFALEALVGYKHFLNDYLGFRYYADIGAQFYKDATFSGNKTKIGVIDYSLNADLLINFLSRPLYSMGFFGGFGVGGAYFDSPELDRYESYYGSATDSTRFTESIFTGIGKVTKNYFNASLGVGFRVNLFQQLSNGQRVCSAGGDGRRTCKITTSRLEHSLEAGVRFFMLPYKATKAPEVVGSYCTNNNANFGTYRCAHYRYGYVIKTPYRFMLRYIIAF